MPSTDEGTTLAAPHSTRDETPSPAIANATHALALKELAEDVTKIRQSVKKLWITVVVLAVLTVAVGVSSFVPSLRFGLGGRPNFRNGEFNGTFRGAPGSGGTATDQGATNQ